MEFLQVIGAVRLNQPYRQVNKDFGCAAWWEEVETIPGIYPLKLGFTGHKFSPITSDYSLYAEICGKVVDDYFPGLFGGVSISKEPYKPKYIGDIRKVSVSISPREAIDKTGNIPDGKWNWYVDPKYWPEFLKFSKEKLEQYYNGLPQYFEEYKAGDDQYDSRVGMVAHYGEYIERYARDIAKIRWRMKWIGMLDKKGSRLNLECYEKNNEWAVKFLNECEKAG